MNVHRKTFMIAASFNNECLNKSSKLIDVKHSWLSKKLRKTQKFYPSNGLLYTVLVIGTIPNLRYPVDALHWHHTLTCDFILIRSPK